MESVVFRADSLFLSNGHALVTSAMQQADALFNMLIIPPRISNNARQRAFRKRNPGYYNKYYARKKASLKRDLQIAQAAAIAEANAANEATAAQPLMLPAPAIDPLMAEINAMTASLLTPLTEQPVEMPVR
jgi:hypothetical protein